MKTCTKCKKEKNINDFFSRGEDKSKKRSHCKECLYKQVNSYNKKNIEKKRENGRKYYAKNKEHISELKIKRWVKQDKNKQKDIYLKRNYNINYEKYLEIVNEQEGKCAICGLFNLEKPLFVDHCHTTGKIRGLLCSLCNTGLGGFRDNTISLLKAIEYLKVADEDFVKIPRQLANDLKKYL
jgi:hypothetical protein